MGPVVYNGCSMAERVGYSHECCFISGHDIQYAVRNECEAIVNFNDDPTASCPNHHLQVFGTTASKVLFTFGPDGINAPNQAGCDRTAGQWSAGQIAIEPTTCVTLEDAGWVNNGINDFAICTDGRGTQSCSGGWCAGCANDESVAGPVSATAPLASSFVASKTRLHSTRASGAAAAARARWSTRCPRDTTRRCSPSACTVK